MKKLIVANCSEKYKIFDFYIFRESPILYTKSGENTALKFKLL